MDYCYPSKFVIEVGRSCWSINWIHLLWSRSLFSWPVCRTKYWYYEEKCWSLFLLKGNVDKWPMAWGDHVTFLLKGNVDKWPIAWGDHITAAIAAATAVILVTNSYGESRDSSCEKSWVPVQNQWVLNWKYLGLYVTRHFIWKQTPKPFSKVCWNLNIVLLFKAQKRLKQVCFVERQPK